LPKYSSFALFLNIFDGYKNLQIINMFIFTKKEPLKNEVNKVTYYKYTNPIQCQKDYQKYVFMYIKIW